MKCYYDKGRFCNVSGTPLPMLSRRCNKNCECFTKCPPDCAGVVKIELDIFTKMMEIALTRFIDCSKCPDSDKDCHFWTSDNRPTTCKYYLAVLEMQKKCL